MKKKMIACLSTLVMIVAGSTTALAAPSPSTDNVTKPVETQKATVAFEKTKTAEEYKSGTTVGEGFKIQETESGVILEIAGYVQNNVISDVAKVGEFLGNKDLVVAAADSGKKIDVSALTVVDIDKDSAVPDANGFYDVTIKNAEIKKNDQLVVLHKSASGTEMIKPKETADGQVSFKVKDFSPFAVLRINVSEIQQAPQTGANMPVGLIAVAAAALVGAVICGVGYAKTRKEE